MKVMIPLVALSLSASAHATLFGPATGGPIPDAVVNLLIPGSLSVTINVAGSGTVASMSNVRLFFGPPTHTWCGDLAVTLIAPNGDDVDLFCRLGVINTAPNSTGDSSDLAGNYLFTEGGDSFLAAAMAEGDLTVVPPATYARSTSDGPLVAGGQDVDPFTIFNGDSINGVWTLRIEDWAILDVGSLGSWSFNITIDNYCPTNVVNTATSANRIDVDDLLAVISGWGACPASPAACPANVVNTGTSVDRVDVDDLLAVIGAWGNCP